jgi:Xaa-Pro aminopeptidase
MSRVSPNPLTSPVLIVASAADPSDLFYGSGFSPVDAVVFLDAGRAKYLVVPLLELGRARRACPRCDILVPQQLGLSKARSRSIAAWALALLRRVKARTIRVPPTFPAAIMRQLEAAGVRVRIVTGPVYPRRAIKSPEEIAHLRAAQRAAVAATDAAIRRIARASVARDGWLTERGARLTSEAVKETIDLALLKHRCLARETIVAGGSRAADPHDRGHGPLRAGEPIVIDIFPQHRDTGYWGDITRTVVRGRARPEIRRMFSTVLRAQREALRMVRAGRKGSDIHAAVQRRFDEAGFPTRTQDGIATGFFHGTGHGVGLDIHEPPSINLADCTLQAGQVVTVEPGLYYPELGGVRIEDTVVVTRDGFRFLAPYPKVLEV